MAQRTIHLLLGNLLKSRTEIKDSNRFLFGSVLPDAIESLSMRDKSHFIKRIDNGQSWFVDFNGFREQFGTLILTDDLYLGYYMHIIEDVLYRNFLYRDYQFQSQLKTEEEIRILHNDYRLLNSYIVNKYNLENSVQKPEQFEKEKINEIINFCVDDFLEEMRSDFLPYENGNTVLLTEGLLDEFVEKYIEICLQELEAVSNNQIFLNQIDYKWEK